MYALIALQYTKYTVYKGFHIQGTDRLKEHIVEVLESFIYSFFMSMKQ